jgi:hypothetical protein
MSREMLKKFLKVGANFIPLALTLSGAWLITKLPAKNLSKSPSPTALIINFATISRTRDSAQFNTKFPIAHTNTLTRNHAKKTSTKTYNQVILDTRCSHAQRDVNTSLQSSEIQNQPKICHKRNYSNYNKLASCCNYQGF